MESQATYWTPHVFHDPAKSSAQQTVGSTVAAQNRFSHRNWRLDPLGGHQAGTRITVHRVPVCPRWVTYMGSLVLSGVMVIWPMSALAGSIGAGVCLAAIPMWAVLRAMRTDSPVGTSSPKWVATARVQARPTLSRACCQLMSPPWV